MKNSMMMGVAIALLSVTASFSSEAAVEPLGYCGPENEWQVQSRSYYHSNGMLKHYYEFTCISGRWENTLFWACNSSGYCTNLS